MANMEERLSSLLSSSDFTVANYINAALEGENDLPSRMAELALQLQLQTQACHEDIAKLGAEIQAIMPRCHADIGRIAVGLEGLQVDATQLLQNIQVETAQDSSHHDSLETLSTLHHLQANLKRSKEILNAAATWDATLQSIPPLLAQHSLQEAVQALRHLENGERALQGMPDLEQRQQAVEQTRRQVLALLQPQLKHALQSVPARLAPLQQCVSLYTQLDMIHVLQQEYVKNRPGTLHKHWFDYGSSSNNNSSSSFSEWLPGWLDMVLKLISEEKRQTLNIFGPTLVPSILIQVFRECFRPIMGSFQSRLENICPLKNAPPTSYNGAFSLQEICNVYEATLKFLSVAYETIAGGLIDLIEAGTLNSDGIMYYKELFIVFGSIMAPFVSYQEQLGMLEQRCSLTLLESVRQDMRTVTSRANSLDDLQTSIDELNRLSETIFPIVESSVARFEVLNAGFGASMVLPAIDSILSEFVQDVRGIIAELSQQTIGDGVTFVEHFDDSLVYTVLHILKIAGSFQGNLRAFEARTRERLNILTERMVSQVSREDRNGKAPRRPTGNSVLIPDAMSPVEIDSALTYMILGESDEEKVNISIVYLQRLGSDNGQLFHETEERAVEMARTCHAFVFGVCSSVPLYHLNSIPSLAIWKQDDVSNDFSSYGALPQQFITQVGEHMLALVQALEPFAAEKGSLNIANRAMHNVHPVASKPWKDLLVACGVVGTDGFIQQLMDGNGVATYVLDNCTSEEEDGTEIDEEFDPELAAFCNTWLDAVGSAVAGRLLERIMKIPSLTRSGNEQLKADLNYLINVFSALGIKGHPHPLLSHVVSLLEDGPTKGGRSDRSDPVFDAIGSMEARLAAMRGFSH